MIDVVNVLRKNDSQYKSLHSCFGNADLNGSTRSKCSKGLHPKRENKPAKRGSALMRCSLASSYEKVRVAGNIFGASDASNDAFSNGGKLWVKGGSPEESVSFFVRFGVGIDASGAVSLALRLRGVLAWDKEAEDPVETKAREAALVLGGMEGITG